MWLYETFKKTCEIIAKEQGIFLGKRVKSKEQLYDLLSEKLNLSRDVIKKWTQPNSKGPSNPTDLKNVEDLLGIKLWNYSDCRFPSIQYSEQCKHNTQKCYILLKDYLNSEDVEDESYYIKVRFEIDKLKIAIPDNIFSQIIEFIDKEIKPIIYNPEEVFASLYTEKYGVMGNDGTFHIKDESALYQILGKHIEIIIDIEKKLDEFALTVLSPVLSK